MWRQPAERDGDDNYRDKNPAAGAIFCPANYKAAASREAVSNCADQS
jgi:hypothetical protein